MKHAEGRLNGVREWLGRFHPRQLRPLFATTDRPRFSFGLELLRLMLDPAIDLSPREVMLYGLHRRDPSRGSSFEYIGEAAWLRRCRRLSGGSPSMLQDRLVLACLMKGSCLRAPDTQALVGVDAPLLPVPSLGSTLELVRFLRRRARYPLVIQPLASALGRGDFRVEALEQDATLIRLADGSRWPLREFAASVVRGGGRGAMVQDRITAHPQLSPACGLACPTVQIVTTLGPAGVLVVLYAVLKLPSAEVFDQRILVAAVDPADGKLGPWRQFAGTFSTAVEPPLPVTAVPDWPGCRDAVLRLHRLDPEALVLGWEVALSEMGPMVLAVQDTPAIELYQVARNSGFRDGPGRALLDKLEQRARGISSQPRHRGRRRLQAWWPMGRGSLQRRSRRAGARPAE